MYLPVPVLVAIGLAFLVLILLAFRRRSGPRDLMAPPPSPGTFAPPPGTPPSRSWPAGAVPVGGLPPELEAEVRRLLAAGNKIEAIKQVRAATHLGLAEAKDMVERM
jgi:hypothetical protein